jgi:alpha-beta hydrolase superfamily lysophospholipase
MGKKLAEEIRYYIGFSFANLDNLKKITFLAHSLGGLITRAALPLLDKYKDKMWSFISLSSPHFGYMYSDSNLISAGLWVLKKWYGAKSLEQLSLSDNKNIKQCFLYRLAMTQGMEWFKNVMLISSYQDFYSPYESSRMELHKQQANTM